MKGNAKCFCFQPLGCFQETFYILGKDLNLLRELVNFCVNITPNLQSNLTLPMILPRQ